jgi:hypothetical protein
MQINRDKCVCAVNGSVRSRGADDEKREVIQQLYRQGFSIEECAEKTYSGFIPSLDENGEPHAHLMRESRFGDPTTYSKQVARWFAWCDTVARYCQEIDGVAASR